MPKPKSKRPLTPRPVMKTETMRFLSKNKATPQAPSKPKSTTNRGSQVPETRSQCVQSSPTLWHPPDRKRRSSLIAKQMGSASKDMSKSPYTPPKSILKQLPKSKLVQFSLNQDNATSEKTSKQNHGKPNRPKHNSRPDVKNQAFLDYLTQPRFEPNNNYHTTHQVYQFETESRFGKPVPVSASEVEMDKDEESETPDGDVGIPSTESEESVDWSVEDDENSGDLEGASYRPPGKKEQRRKTEDEMTWETLYEIEAQQNADREKDHEKRSRGRKEKPVDKEERRYRFKSTYQLLVPKQIEKDKLIDLNIIVRRSVLPSNTYI